MHSAAPAYHRHILEKPLISSFDALLMPFETVHLPDSKLIWWDKAGYAQVAHEGAELTEEAFLNRFSYGVIGNPRLADVKKNTLDTKTFFADRYGGCGLATHGGSGRAGLTGRFQIKGIGPTPLVGCAVDTWHFDGCMNLSDSTYEVLADQIYGAIIGNGTTPIYGLLVNGKNTAQIYKGGHEYTTEYGALIVRSAELRPASFLRNQHFRPQRWSITENFHNTHYIDQSLKQLNDNQTFEAFLFNMMENATEIMASARLLRIAHGMLSPSNIDIHGRWLDLVHASFTDGLNLANDHKCLSFGQEPSIVQQAYMDLAEEGQQRLGASPDSKTMGAFFTRTFKEKLIEFCPYVFGLSPRHPNTATRIVNEQVQRVILKNHPIIIGCPTGFKTADPLLGNIISAFHTLTQDDTPHVDDSNFKAALHQMFRDQFYDQNLISYRNYIRLAAIRALCRNRFMGFFARGQIMGHIRRILSSRDLSKLAPFMERTIAARHWLYPQAIRDKQPIQQNAQHSLFEKGSLKLSFDARLGHYTLKTVDHIQCWQTAQEVSTWVDRQDQGTFIINRYDFRPGLKDMLKLLTQLESKFKTPTEWPRD